MRSFLFSKIVIDGGTLLKEDIIRMSSSCTLMRCLESSVQICNIFTTKQAMKSI